MQTLREAIAFCTEAVGAMDEAGAAGYITQGPAEVPRSAALAGLLAHDAEMFGISTVYLRARTLFRPAASEFTRLTREPRAPSPEPGYFARTSIWPVMFGWNRQM